MKQICGCPERDRESRSIFTHNGFTYELKSEYGQFPAGFTYSMFSGGSCDRDDNLYMLCRDPERPVVMLDAEGKYVKSFGKGLFKEVHSLYVTPQNITTPCQGFDPETHNLLGIEFTIKTCVDGKYESLGKYATPVRD